MSKTDDSPLPASQEMPKRLAACLAGVPAICDQRVCRREGRCLGDGVPCFARHGARIMEFLQAASKGAPTTAMSDEGRG